MNNMKKICAFVAPLLDMIVERPLWKNNTQTSYSLSFWGIFNGAQFIAFPRITKIYVKGVRAPGEYRVSMNTCCFIFLWNPLPHSYISAAASISMATPLHHHLKLNGATPRTGRPLLWGTTPLRHTPIGVREEEWGVGRGKLDSLGSRQLVSQP